MSDYKRKLRSGKVLPEIATPKKNKEIKKNNECEEQPTCPRTPPSQSIEPYFPPSPFGKKRHQPHGDRFIPSRDRNLARDFQMMASAAIHTKNTETTNSGDPPSITGESRRFNAYFRAELLDDPTAVSEFTSDSSRPPRRVLQYTPASTASHINNSSNSINTLHHTSPSHYTRSHSPESVDPHLPVLSPSPNREYDSPTGSRFQVSPIGEAGRRILLTSDRHTRHINPTAIKILDAPDLQDDFYLNLVDWGVNDSLAVGLGSCVYLWNANTSKVTKLCDLATDTITSVNWAHLGSLLAVGTHSGKCMLFDAEHSKKLRTWSNHSSRIGSIAWKSNILTTGGRDHAIYHHDVRSPQPFFRKLTGHTQELCGLKWNSEGTMLASGGNDNNLIIWNSHENIITHRLTQHTAAVKAISWNPHKRGILVSGGGTADKTIKFWNTNSGSLISSHDTGSQVCNLAWSKKTEDIVSTHGYSSNAANSSNQVVVWKADKMQRIATLTGHVSRVLYMSMSNDGSTVVTGAGDETLRFWDIFSSVETTRPEREDRQACLR
ncbi:hypothetical protein INT48_002130 [Thamnidium elegans]|uniref:CDC20/Fizzy WD40 domain-containing protein n=1 Tax=Thamnidium elegans TaxID=101142 RepID=A0A8H7SYE3_9FUNG|nr:hypothetical protein INT48_002130 [Thamnidium elegans]